MVQGLFHPVIGRELSRELRRPGLYAERFFVAAVGSALGMFSVITGDPEFHQILFVSAGGFAAWKTLSLTMSVFAEERRNGTLGLLFLAGLSAWEVFLMKLIGGMARVVMHLIGILPFQAFPFLAGGLSAELFVSTIAVLALWVFFVFAAGALGSALCREDEHALAVALLLIVGIGAFPLVAAYGGAFFSAPSAFSLAAVSADWLWICPGYLAVLVLDQLRSFSAAAVWDAGLATLGWGSALLLVAFRMVGVGGQDDRTVVERFRSRLAARRLGSSSVGRRLRLQWLDKDPSAWLVLRDRGTARLMWSFLGVLGFLLGVFCWFWGTVWLTPGAIYLLAIVWLAGLSWLSLYTVGRRIGEDRRSGVLELLLTTGLSPREIVNGQRRGVRRMFWLVLMGVFRVLFLLSLGSLLLRGEVEGWAWVSFLLAWIALSGFLHGVLNMYHIRVMWISLNSARPAFAVFKVLGESGGFVVGILPSLFMFGGDLLSEFLIQFPSGSWLELFFICALGLFVLGMILVSRSLFGWETLIEKKLIAEFRSIAAEPVPEKSDPRFKGWDWTKRLSENRPLR